MLGEGWLEEEERRGDKGRGGERGGERRGEEGRGERGGERRKTLKTNNQNV